MGPRENHDEAFDRDRWRESVAGRTLYLTARDAGQDDTGDPQVGRKPAACGLCDEQVLPVTEDGTKCCPICGFAVGATGAERSPSERIGSR